MGASEQGVSVFYSEVRPSPTIVRGEKDIEHDNVFYRARNGRSRGGGHSASWPGNGKSSNHFVVGCAFRLIVGRHDGGHTHKVAINGASK